MFTGYITITGTLHPSEEMSRSRCQGSYYIKAGGGKKSSEPFILGEKQLK